MSYLNTPPWYVISGGPSSGKSTTIGILKDRGYQVTQEQARAIIDQEMAQGKNLEEIRGDAELFQHNILMRQLDLESKLDPTQTVFLDRGIPDGLAYAAFLRLKEDPQLPEASRNAQYRKVFILDLLPLHDDGSRIEDRESQQQIHDHLIDVYEKLGCDVVRVPAFEKHERVDFILSRLS